MNTNTPLAPDFESAWDIAHAACEEARKLASYAASRGGISMSEDEISAIYEAIMASLGHPDPDELPAPPAAPRKSHLRLISSRP